ncbi:Ig-like domain-containing protein [Candidatus Dojkabacteria bacterium]|nr:Ig-like domain-containing protein [Candidatus Dojkabacteria bacterium]
MFDSIIDFFKGIDWDVFFSTFRFKFVLAVLILVSLLLVNGISLLMRKIRKNKNSKMSKKASESPSVKDEATTEEKAEKKPRLKLPVFLTKFGTWLGREKLLVFDVILVVAEFVVLGFLLLERPRVVSTSPEVGANMESGEDVIEVEFDVPVDTSNIKFNISPEVDGKWVWEKGFLGLPFKTKAKFYPDESIYPDREVVVYVVGMRQWWGGGKSHEHSIEFRSPEIPDVDKIIPDNEAENVPVDSEVEVYYDAPVGDFVDLTYVVEPEVKFEVKNGEEKNKHTVKFFDGLDQDETYSIEIYRTPRSYDVDHKDKAIKVGDTEKLEEITFRTVTTPLIKEYKPKGNGVLADSDIEVVFDQEMDQPSVEDNFVIEPDTDGEISWKDEKTFVFSPKEDLKKETDYKITFKKGILSKYSGEIDEDIVIKFKTIGRVAVASMSPVSGSAGHDPKTVNVVIEFNQEVDHASAQQHFSISPRVSGTFGWDGNKLIYYTAGKLNFSTRYTVTLSSGIKTVHGLDSNKAFSYYFITKDNIFALNVPWYKQQESFTCNLAAARMALAYRGVYVSESQIKSAIGIGGNPNANWVSGYGVHWGPVAGYISNYRQVSIKSGWNSVELAKEVEKGNPVIVWWYNRYSQPPGPFTLDSGATGYMGMHSEVVRGFIGSSSNPSSFMTNDPWRGRLTYSRAGFESTWAYLGYIAVVVY